MENFFMAMKMVSSLIVVGILSWFFYVYVNEWYKSERIRRKLMKQGITGPPPSFLRGNLPDMQRIQAQVRSTMKAQSNNNSNKLLEHYDFTATLFPYFEHWRKQYGPLYTYSTGRKQHLYVNQPDLVREINSCNTLDIGKPARKSNQLAPLFGNGILSANGPSWAHQRKLLAPEFFMNKVKGMVELMVESVQPLLTKWEEQCIEAAEGYGNGIVEIQVDVDLGGFSADVISRVCFGHSYSKGKEIFSKIRTLKETLNNNGYLFGRSGFGVTKKSVITNLEKEIESLIWELVEERKASNSSKKDLMHSLLEAVKNDENIGEKFCKQFIVDNCKTIYMAGQETTAISASWCLLLLALNPQWQTRIRAEVAQYCPNGIVDVDSLSLLKTVTMVIQEALRLYSPGAFVTREAFEDIQIGNLHIPKGVNLWTLIPTMHRDTENWGPDACEFKPERFKDGVSKACKFPQSYAPFGLGGRLCVGKNLAMMELKIVLALIISKFNIIPSPSYKHSPAFSMVIQPEHGVHLFIQKI
ncbi:putative cytochrome P450 [Lupinus albus]|uniref:Putative cytochrome P450 n=1 Tax=Lupinus albus TaxID=3870 RepID=A0A6A4QNS3_LUPAL|nr:putative cytochrome P450 [Lupinus albus]